jgi:BCD family chlorophyll transporter-like MFS transporter
MTPASLSWFQIFRLGLVQAALGAIVVLTTSTLNRIMIVELALPATLPGALVGLHYALQVLRPRLGHGSDIGGRRTPWILGGMTVLACGGVGAAIATAWMTTDLWAGIGLAVLAFFMIGIGVGACGTTLLVLLAKRVDAHRRAAAATIVWVMMIVGFIVTTAVAGRLLDPYSPGRLVAVASAVSVLALVLTVVAIWNVEGPVPRSETNASHSPARNTSFGAALAEAWSEPRARRFTIFIFVSMLAYSAPELILEPFAGAVFGLTPGESTTLASVQHGGVLAGMVLVAILSTVIGGRGFTSMRIWTVGGCAASALALVNLAVAGLAAPAWPLRTAVFLLGLSNGVYAVAAIGSMMSLVGVQKSREGVRMGLWGAAQAIAFGLGGFVGTLASDFARFILGSASLAYGAVFVGEAALFLISSGLALRVYAAEKPLATRAFDTVAGVSVAD